jgi:PAS domain S-box-containing protein
MHGKPQQADKDRLRSYFEQAPGMIAMVSGPEHIFEFANAAYLALIGDRDVIGRPVRDAVPELEAQGVVALLDEVYSTGEPFIGRQMPFVFHRQTGAAPETRYIDYVYQPVRDDQGRVTGIFAEGLDVTEQVRSQAALRESEARFRLFSEETREGVAIHNGQTVLDCNTAFARMFGYETVETVIGCATTDFVTPESGATIREKNLLKQEQPYRVEARRKDGSTFSAEFVGRETTWHGQHVRIGLARDLTAQDRTEAAIRASQARLEAAVRASAHLFYEWNSTTNALTFGSNIERMLGYTADEMSGGLARWVEIVHPDDQAAFSAEISRVLATNEPFRLAFRIIRKDQRIIEVEDEGYFLHGVHGHIEHMVGFVRDVTARKQAEREREVERTRLEAVLRQSPVGIIIAEAPSCKLILGNEQVDRIWRHEYRPVSEVEEYRTYKGFDRTTGRELEAYEWPLARSITTGEVVLNEEIDIERGDGSRGTLMVNSAPVYDDADGIIAGVVVFTDITEQAVAERQQRLLVNELNHRVKNTLATVQSLATQAFRGISDRTLPRLRAFEERLFALARAHDILTRESWEGAELREVMEEVLEPYRRQSGERIQVDGPHLRLTPGMALALAMAVHELATNAAKYGALSVPEGRVSIWWERTDTPPSLALHWREEGGPPVAPPTRRGFGTRLIERTLAADLSGEVQLSYRPEGVVCVIKAPLIR